ncbi:unnamed protein product [Callosobruchus maculatus]|uniref:C2H2-type domain-containing protein n=1 Tax=Callosobruchus maculatus TaxID=64391 RepID=A0A653BNY5_CALMS|nr:unnamed protein product [Callosobruchus maculatus]
MGGFHGELKIAGHTVSRCKNCGRTYKSKPAYSRHINHECGKVEIHTCPVCSRTYKRKDIMKTHIKDLHPDYYIRERKLLENRILSEDFLSRNI